MPKRQFGRIPGILVLAFILFQLSGCTDWTPFARDAIRLVELTDRENDIVDVLGYSGSHVFEITSNAYLGNCLEYWVDHYIHGRLEERLAAGTIMIPDARETLKKHPRMILIYQENPVNGEKSWRMAVKFNDHAVCDEFPALGLKHVHSWSQHPSQSQFINKGEPFTLLTLDVEKAIPAPAEIVEEETKSGARMVRLLEDHTYIFRAEFVEKKEWKS